MLMLHFGMNGSLPWRSPAEPWHRHDRIAWQFDDGEPRFRGMRKLPGIRLTHDEIRPSGCSSSARTPVACPAANVRIAWRERRLE
ncbi:hypothetical protein [Nonomuraea guangzhouensis]|uniref:Formamidopyrimidine-DNA glycosylase catalytic domain-containing protein n=1 Tax=Nonomuraea guangzhouensis TaxID=1291555 RepID=A0ABW4GUY6_9ACTN